MIESHETAVHDSPGPLRVAYLVSLYPALSHAFIEREILGLRARGVEVETFSVRPCPDEQLLTDVMRSEAARTDVLIGGDNARYARAHAELVRAHGTAWISVLRRALGTGEANPRSRVWQGFYFAEAVLMHSLLVERGIRHLHVHFPNVSADVARLVVALGRYIDGPDSGWRWTMTIHGPTEFEAVEKVDLAAKCRDAHAISAITDFARSQVLRQVEPAHWDKVTVNRLGIDVAAFSPPADDRSGRQGPIRLLTVGRLVAEKGAPVFLDALAELQRRGVDFEARFIGGGPLAVDFEKRATDLGLAGRVTFMGPLGQDRLPEWYHWADAFVLASFQEGLPVVIMEALATELPVVSTRIAGIPELVVDGVTGLVVSPGNVPELADAIARLSDDPDLRRTLGRAGREAVLARHDSTSSAASMERFHRAAQSGPRT